MASQKVRIVNNGNIVDSLIDLFGDKSVKEIEIVCCDKNGPNLRTNDKVLNVRGLISVDDAERYHQITIEFEHFSWTFHHKIPKDSILKVNDNEYRLNYTHPFICGQFLIRVYRRDENGTPSEDWKRNCGLTD